MCPVGIPGMVSALPRVITLQEASYTDISVVFVTVMVSVYLILESGSVIPELCRSHLHTGNSTNWKLEYYKFKRYSYAQVLKMALSKRQVLAT